MSDRPTRSPAENYADLLERLRRCNTAYRVSDDPGERLAAVAGSLAAVINFLDADLTIRTEGLTGPLGAAATAANDLAWGGSPALFFEVPRSENRHTSLSSDFWRAVSMKALDILLSAKVPLAEAASIVSNECYSQGRQIEANTVLAWRANPGRASENAQNNLALLRNMPAHALAAANRSEAVARVKDLIRIQASSGT